MDDKQLIVTGSENELIGFAVVRGLPRKSFLRITRAEALHGRKLKDRQIWLFGSYDKLDDAIHIIKAGLDRGATFRRVLL